MNKFEKILILDYGSQYTQLIARRIRELNVYSEIATHKISIDELRNKMPKAIILSGGPMSVYEKDSYQLNKYIFDLNIPILGICLGHQAIAVAFGGRVISANEISHGKIVEINHSKSKIFKSARNIPNLKVIDQEGANVYDILKYKNVVFTISSIKTFQEKAVK